MVRELSLVALAVCIAGLGGTNRGQSGEKSKDEAVGIAQQITNDPERYRTDFHRLRLLVGDDCVVDAVITAAKEASVDKQQILVDVITTLGSQLPDLGESRISRYRFVESARVIDFCVGLLKSPHPRLRSKAANILSTRVRPKEIHSRTTEILAAIAKPTSSAEYLILGMTRNRKAMERLPKPSDVEESLLLARQLAAAMLGDSAAEKGIIDQFCRTDSPEQRNELAMALARIGSSKALTVLANALRSPYVARWGGGGKQSFRLIVIASLSWAYPEERILWEPRTPPTSDKYYEAIEQWAEKQFGVQWDHPRPPFMYQEYAPMFPRIQQPSLGH